MTPCEDHIETGAQDECLMCMFINTDAFEPAPPLSSPDENIIEWLNSKHLIGDVDAMTGKFFSSNEADNPADELLRITLERNSPDYGEFIAQVVNGLVWEFVFKRCTSHQLEPIFTKYIAFKQAAEMLSVYLEAARNEHE